MTPADEATFIQLWQEGASYQVIAQALRRPLGTTPPPSTALVSLMLIISRIPDPHLTS